MGNTPSTASPRSQPQTQSQTKTQPPPPPPPVSRSRPLKGKKRSIVDHPALLASAALPAPTTPRSAPIPIPIPAAASSSPRPAPPRPVDSFADAADLLPGPRAEASTHRPIQYNSTRSFGAVRRGGVQGTGWRPPAPPAFVPEVVRSSIPLRITERGSSSDDDDDGLVPTTFVWGGGGKEVFLAGTFDPLEWRARVRMRFDPASATHTLTLALAPGTYRLKFIVDDAWRCADTLPTATDDETGNLVNYIDVEDASALDAAGTDEERQGRDARVMKANRRRTYRARRWHPPQLPPSESAFWGDPDTDTELEAVGWGRGRDGVLEKWTSTIPAPLVAAAQQEEARSLRAPAVPPAPRLPRHLDKVILNTRTSSSAPPAGKIRGGSRSRLGMTSLLPPGPQRSSSTAAVEQWAPADDSSVLPVPSHVVLHHLGTSAIKNGVLAVSDTTRYNKKYITTIYYKPA